MAIALPDLALAVELARRRGLVLPGTKGQDFSRWRGDPVGFSREALGVKWWARQEEIACAVRDCPEVAVEAGHSVGKCVAANEPIQLADGTVCEAQELVGRYFGIISLDASWSLIPALAMAQWDGKKPMFRIRTKTGREITRTGNHQLLRWNGWVAIEDLRIGDKIAIPLALPIKGNRPMAETEVKFLAYMIGDGHCCHTPAFSQSEGKVLNEALACARALGCTPRLQARRSNAFDYTFVVPKNRFFGPGGIAGSNPIKELLRRNGLWGKLSREKTIPSSIFELPNEQLALFLNRLFACDGWVCSSQTKAVNIIQIGYSSISERLVQQIALLLLRFGIYGNVRKRSQKINDKPYHSFEWFTNAKQNIVRFLASIGPILDKEEACIRVLEEAKNRKDGRYTTGPDVFPVEAWEDMIAAAQKIDKTAYWLRENGGRSGRQRSQICGPTRVLITRAANLLGASDILKKSNSAIGWDEIVAIEPMGIQMSVDISVPTLHNFVGQVVEHNTYAAAGLAIWWIMVWEDAKVVTTATSFYQVVDLLWREIRSQFTKAKVRLPGNLFRTRLDLGPQRFAVGISPKEEVNFLGYHSDHLLVILDEAAGVRPDIWGAVDSLAVGKDNRKLAIGNPMFSEGHFWEACHGSRKQWKTIRIPSMESPNATGGASLPGLVGREWIMEQIEGHCEPCGEGDAGAFEFEGQWYMPDRWFEAHALARPPTSAAGNKVIPEAWLDAVMDKV